MKKEILKILTEQRILKYAGGVSYARGEQYFEEGSVTALQVEEAYVRAKVQGTHLYRVKLWETDGKLDYSCTCPLYQRDEVFCKHCVAAALAAREAGVDSSVSRRTGKNKSKTKVLTEADIEKYLMAQNKESLVSLLMGYSRSDDRIYEKLRMQAAAVDPDAAIDTFKQSIDDAVSWDEFVDYRSVPEYVGGIEDVVQSLDDLLKQGHAKAVIELAEYFLRHLEKHIEMVDDSDGYMGDMLYQVQELHYKACMQEKPDPEMLAKKLFKWELNSEWDVFHGAAKKYSRVFGKKGVKLYRELAEAEWSRVAAIGPGREKDRYEGNRNRITHIMETLAGQSRDVEQLVAIKSKDLSYPYSYLEIAQIYNKAGKKELALEWAEKGVRAFPKHRDDRLHEFLANEYHKRKRHKEAMDLIWHLFTDSPHLESFKQLKKHAGKAGGAGSWREWREKALLHIREIAEKEKRRAKKTWYSYPMNSSELVRIFLWEKNVEQAWQEAKEGGCSEGLWLELARLRKKDHPEDAIPVYRKFVEPTIEQKNDHAYREAVTMLKKVKQLMHRLDKKEEWRKYLEEIKTTHKRKRNFMAMLNRIDT